MQYDNPLAASATDISASFVALANALDAKGALTKGELARAAQERLLVLRRALPPAYVEQLGLLKALATEIEQMPPDEWPAADQR